MNDLKFKEIAKSILLNRKLNELVSLIEWLDNQQFIDEIGYNNFAMSALLLLEKKADFDNQNYKLIKDFLIDNQKALEAFRVASDRQTDTIEELVKIIKDLIITKQRSKK